jgi:ketosteroid isomerase-like protein
MTPIHTINQFYQAIIEKRVADICANYVLSEQTYVFVEGPRYSTLGYAAIAKGWGDFCDSALKLLKIEWLEGPFAQENQTLACVSGMIILTVEVKEKVFSVQFRASFVLQKMDTTWQISHEHVSIPATDPYGIGDWLKA